MAAEMLDAIFLGEEAESGNAIWGVVLAPSLMMLLGSMAVFYLQVPDRVQACFQNFSGGLLFSAVAGELFPLLTDPASAGVKLGPISPLESNGGLIGGFFIGLLFMFGLEQITEGGDDDDDEEEDDKKKDDDKMGPKDSQGSLARIESEGSAFLDPLLPAEDLQAALKSFQSEVPGLQSQVLRLQKECLPTGSRENIDELVHELMYKVDRAKRQLALPEPLEEANLKRMKFHVEELKQNADNLGVQSTMVGAKKAIKLFEGTLNHIHKHNERRSQVFRRWHPKSKPRKGDELPERIPWALTFAVTTDAAVDGLLVGLAYTASPGAGWCMSIATCIEMCFLGLSFSASLQHATRYCFKHATLSIVPPLTLALFGCFGHFLGSMLEQNPGFFIGFIAFSIVALLFLVTQELLMEARDMGGDSLFVNILFFIGLLSGILLEKVLG